MDRLCLMTNEIYLFWISVKVQFLTICEVCKHDAGDASLKWGMENVSENWLCPLHVSSLSSIEKSLNQKVMIFKKDGNKNLSLNEVDYMYVCQYHY